MIEELAVAHVLLAAVALISCLSVPEKRTIRRMPRALWVIVILLIPLAGSIGWFTAGRPLRIRLSRPGWRERMNLQEPPRPPAPEDDPEFLRSLDHPEPPNDPEPGPHD